MAAFDVLSFHMLVQAGYLIYGPRYEPEDSRLGNRSPTHSKESEA
jgi:hypothetical protein